MAKRPEAMTFKAVNCLYAGWQHWLRAEGQTTIQAGNLDAWHKQWGFTEGDNHLPLPWPRRFPARPEDKPPTTMRAAGVLSLTTVDLPSRMCVGASTVTEVQGSSGALAGEGVWTPFPSAAKVWLAKTSAANRLRTR